MASGNEYLGRAKAAQEDEFYTTYEAVSAELTKYADQLRGKRIICPCDWDESLDEILVYASEDYVAGHDLFSPGGSVKVVDTDATDAKVMKDIGLVSCNFVKFLIAHAEAYGIASIAVSGYNPATEEGVRFQDIDYTNYDVAITNPPFSQIREFVDVMFDNGMDFLILAPQLAAKAKNIFPRIVHNEMWLGYYSGDMAFKVPDYFEPRETRYWQDESGQKWRSLGNICWLTTLDVSYRHDWMILVEEYAPEKYPAYSNLDAIEVHKVSEIPYDYKGMMGVPVTFLQKFNPDQFEVIGLGEGDLAKEIGITRNHTGRTKLCYPIKDGFKEVSARVVIRNKHPEERGDAS